MSTWTVVVAAGLSSRFGRAKQYEQLGGRRVLDWSLHAARATSDGVVVVVAPDMAAALEPAADAVVAGGATRSASVRAGLAAVPEGAEIVVIHDAARPLASPSLFDAVTGALADGIDGAVCAVPVTDTIKRVAGGIVVSTVERGELWAVQTPQAFRAPILRVAHAGEPVATDDAALVEAVGGAVAVVAGDPRNRKLTGPLDLVVAEALVATITW